MTLNRNSFPTDKRIKRSVTQKVGKIHFIDIMMLKGLSMLSWQQLCSESSPHSCRPWCTHQGCPSGHSHSPRRQCPGAVHCRQQGHQSPPRREKYSIEVRGIRKKDHSTLTWRCHSSLALPPLVRPILYSCQHIEINSRIALLTFPWNLLASCNWPF